MQLEALRIGYGSRVILSDISLKIIAGTCTAILGFNGAGKSTLLRTIAGLQAPFAGKVLVDDQDLHRMDVRTRAQHLSIVLSDRNEMAQALRVYEVLSMAVAPHREWFRSLHADEWQRIQDTSARMHIQHLQQRQLHQLSDGEMQKVAIARALLQDTPIILLDEPTAHLDLHHKIEVFALMRALSEEGKTIVFTSHDIEPALRTATDIVLVGDGKVQSGTVSEIMHSGAIAQYFSTGSVSFNADQMRFDYRI